MKSLFWFLAGVLATILFFFFEESVKYDDIVNNK